MGTAVHTESEYPGTWRTTMLELVDSLQSRAASVDDVVAMAAWLIRTGQVELTGNFRGTRVLFP